MQIRNAKRKKGGDVFEFVRWTYDADKGRSVGKVLGRMPIGFTAIPLVVTNQCTPAEKEELAFWWSETNRERARAQAMEIISNPRLDTLQRAIQGIGKDVTADQAQEILDGVKSVEMALRELGHRRIAKAEAPHTA
jgi:hypothetical protein